MTTDERIDAIAMNLELTAAMHRDYEAKAEARAAETNANINRLVGVVDKLAGIVAGLAHTAQEHEDRIDRLEGR